MSRSTSKQKIFVMTYPPEMLPYPQEDAEVFVCENHHKQQCENCVMVPTFHPKH